MTIMRTNHFSSVYRINSNELQHNGKTIESFGHSVSLDSLIETAEKLINKGDFDSIDIVEVTEKVCLDCGETSVRTEQLHVSLARV